MTASPPPGGGERKLVSVLAAEVDERVEEFAERDPEDVRAVQARHLGRVRAEVERFGGAVEHVIGGRSLAVFGSPRAHEDDPERAVRAALAIRDAAAGTGSHARAAVVTGSWSRTRRSRPRASWPARCEGSSGRSWRHG